MTLTLTLYTSCEAISLYTLNTHLSAPRSLRPKNPIEKGEASGSESWLRQELRARVTVVMTTLFNTVLVALPHGYKNTPPRFSSTLFSPSLHSIAYWLWPGIYLLTHLNPSLNCSLPLLFALFPALPSQLRFNFTWIRRIPLRLRFNVFH